jgi:hypothetical protein
MTGMPFRRDAVSETIRPCLKSVLKTFLMSMLSQRRFDLALKVFKDITNVGETSQSRF